MKRCAKNKEKDMEKAREKPECSVNERNGLRWT